MESTYGHPRYRLPPRDESIAQLSALVTRILNDGRTPVVHAYVLGKAQEVTRILTLAGIRIVQHPRVVQILSRAKPRERVLLITDAISAAGMADGQYRLGRDSVQVSGGVCRDLHGRLAGSTLSQDVALQNFVNWSLMNQM